MSDPHSTSNVKIYDRPEKKGPSPIVIVLALLIVLVLAFGVYRAMHSGSGSTPAANENTRNASSAKSAASP